MSSWINGSSSENIRPEKAPYRNLFRTVMILLLCIVLACSAGAAAALSAGQPAVVQAAAFSGWKKVSGKWFYYTSGKVRTGWVKVGGKTYYVDARKGRRTGFAFIAGKKYYFDKNGVMTTGWQTINGYKYYMGGNGQIRRGFQTIGGKKYYFWTTTANGHYSSTLATKFFTVSGQTYYAGSNGQIRTGWQTINGYKYHMDAAGAMQTGWQTINKKKYYFYKSNSDGHYKGTMAAGRYIEGRYLDVRGVYRSNVSEKAAVSKASDWKLENGAASTRTIMHFRKGDLVSLRKGYELILWDINTEKPLCTYSAGMIVPKSMYAVVTVRKANCKAISSSELNTVASQIQVTSQTNQNYSKNLDAFRKTVRYHKSSGYYEVAHRGASQYSPQNTLASFKLAAQLGFDAVETDIRFTKDNVPVILHDETINSTSNGRGRISDMTLAQAKKYNFGNSSYGNQKIPTLKETVRTCKENGLTEYLEIKTHLSEAQAKNIVSIVRSGGMSSNTVWLVWENSTSNLEKMNRLADKSSAIGILSEAMTGKTISLAVSLKKKSGREFWISACADSITKGLIDKAHKSGIKVNAWTLTSNNQAAQFYQWGIDSITTNGYVNVKNYLESQTNPGTTSTYASAGAPENDLSDDAAAAGAAIEEPVSDAQEDGSVQETDGQGMEAAGEEAAAENTEDPENAAGEDAAAENTVDPENAAGENVIAENTADSEKVSGKDVTAENTVDLEKADNAEEKDGEISEAPAKSADEKTEAPAEHADEITEIPAESADENVEAPAEIAVVTE